MFDMGIQRLAIVSVPVSDQDRAKAFYTDVLGFVVGRDSPFRDNARWIEVKPTTDSTLTITLVTWFPSMPPGSLRGLVLLADDLDATYATLQKRGLATATAIQSAPWGRYATFSDPDGNGWVLQEARHLAAAQAYR
jgi:catechol 2,3-dioxygenase-like lactoylglutathione lyase family enzyme